VASIYLPPWRIDVSARPGVRSPVSRAELARVAARALTAASGPSPASLAIVLSDDRELAELNVRHMGHEGPTDVLSFPMLPASEFPAHAGQDPDARRATATQFVSPASRRPHLGDIVVSVERAVAQAPDQGWSVANELRQLVVHGVLHVCGWDHAQSVERDAMRALESAVLDAR
jgi:probable rRNA maturation factor